MFSIYAHVVISLSLILSYGNDILVSFLRLLTRTSLSSVFSQLTTLLLLFIVIPSILKSIMHTAVVSFDQVTISDADSNSFTLVTSGRIECTIGGLEANMAAMPIRVEYEGTFECVFVCKVLLEILEIVQMEIFFIQNFENRIFEMEFFKF